MARDNYLYIKNPDLFKEIHPTKNEGIDIYKIMHGSDKKIWWLGECGHEWEASVSSRDRGNKCPYCSNQKVLAGYNDLATVNPKIASEWDYDKNYPITPKDVITGSNKEYWFICEKGHSFKSAISTRYAGRNCPVCANKVILPGYNDFETWCKNNDKQYLLDEWDYDKNEILPSQVSKGAEKQVYWKGKCGHSWKQFLYSRTGKHEQGCPICGKELKTSFPEQVVYFYIKKHFPDAINGDKEILNGKEIDVLIPSLKTAIEFDGNHWHDDKQRDIEKALLIKDKGYHLIRIRDAKCPTINDGSQEIIISSYSYKELENTIQKIYELLGIVDNEINVNNNFLAIKEQYTHKVKNNSLAALYPNIAKEWDYEKNRNITPNIVAAKDNHKYWFICEVGHSYQARLSDRTLNNTGCPYCSNPPRKILPGFNDLATKFPDIANEWDYEKNTKKPNEVACQSNSKFWFICENGHSYSTSAYSRTKLRTGCPICANKKVLPGYNDLATKFPEIAKQWDYELNTLTPREVLPGSNKKYAFICSEGHKWSAALNSRTSNGYGCPECYKEKHYKRIYQ